MKLQGNRQTFRFLRPEFCRSGCGAGRWSAPLVAVVAFFVYATSAAGATNIYYSAGTETSALYTGNASASSGTLTLASAAADNIGVGDEIRHGDSRYYITGRNSPTESNRKGAEIAEKKNLLIPFPTLPPVP